MHTSRYRGCDLSPPTAPPPIKAAQNATTVDTRSKTVAQGTRRVHLLTAIYYYKGVGSSWLVVLKLMTLLLPLPTWPP